MELVRSSGSKVPGESTCTGQIEPPYGLEQHSTFALCSFQRRTLEGRPLSIFYYVKYPVMDGESGYICETCGS